MAYKEIFNSIFFAFAILSLISRVFAAGLDVGSPAPAFRVISGDNKELASGDLKGKVAVIFYEARNAVEENRRLKNALNEFYAGQPAALKKDIAKIGVVYCQGVFFRGIWEKALRDHSRKEGLILYGDWDGKMADAYHFSKDQSNVIIIDKKGIIRYYACGFIADKDIDMIEKLLNDMAREN